MSINLGEIGDRCSNGPWMDRWTCPNCYHDHDAKVTVCEQCGAGLSCSTEYEPHAYCVLESLPATNAQAGGEEGE